MGIREQEKRRRALQIAPRNLPGCGNLELRLMDSTEYNR